MPIRILRFHKRPPRQEELLSEVAGKLAQFLSQLGDVLVAPGKPLMEHCIGCGKIGVFFCDHCRELDRLARIKADKPMSTVEQRFAMRRFQ